MEVGQRVEVRQGDAVQLGTVKAYLLAIAAVHGYLEEECRVVVQTDRGGIIFARPAEVSILGSPQQKERIARMRTLREEFAASTPAASGEA